MYKQSSASTSRTTIKSLNQSPSRSSTYNQCIAFHGDHPHTLPQGRKTLSILTVSIIDRRQGVVSNYERAAFNSNPQRSRRNRHRPHTLLRRRSNSKERLGDRLGIHHHRRSVWAGVAGIAAGVGIALGDLADSIAGQEDRMPVEDTEVVLHNPAVDCSILGWTW